MVGVAIRMHLNEILKQAENAFLDELNSQIQVGRVVQYFYFRMNFPEQIASIHQVVIYLSRS